MQIYRFCRGIIGNMSMKIVAGLGSIDEYIPYVKAGADELFCGYIPEKWALKYGMKSPLNRREVMYYNVQIGSESELLILSEMVKKYGVPVTITFNSLYYLPQQYSLIIDIIEQCVAMGFDSFIVADPALLYYMRNNAGIGNIKIYLSGETAEVNHLMIEEFCKYGINRVIFHRKNSLEDMAQIIANMERRNRSLEYEAFVLNEKCHFTGAFCNSLHCDELAHICRLPYKLGNLKTNMTGCGNVKNMELDINESDESSEDSKNDYITGKSGCGLCALWKMHEMGVTHLKLVSRGNYVDDTINDIEQLKNALTILDNTLNEEEYMCNMKKMLFKDGRCSGNCYYYFT